MNDTPDTPIDTTNQHLIGVTYGRAGATSITVSAPPFRLDPDEALLHAAWLVAMAEPLASHKFADVLAAVQGT